MARLNREQLEAAVKREVGEKYSVVASDAETGTEAGAAPGAEPDAGAAPGAEVEADAPAANIDAVMKKYAKIFRADAPERGAVTSTATAAVLESDEDVVGDVPAPTRRVRVFNEKGELEAEQG